MIDAPRHIEIRGWPRQRRAADRSLARVILRQHTGVGRRVTNEVEQARALAAALSPGGQAGVSTGLFWSCGGSGLLAYSMTFPACRARARQGAALIAYYGAAGGSHEPAGL